EGSTGSGRCAWLVPLGLEERWLVLGTPGERGDGGRTTAAGTRTLVYATAMVQARTRVAKALGVIRRARGLPAAGALYGDPGAIAAELKEGGAWLGGFHPRPLLGIDYRRARAPARPP